MKSTTKKTSDDYIRLGNQSVAWQPTGSRMSHYEIFP